ncbi:MAG: hypothetical protein AB1898_27515 [Acidobacteriota bacterium]
MPNRTEQNASGSPIDIGKKKQLFLDELLIESKKGVTLTFNPPYTPRENLLPQDKPWEEVRAGGFSSILEHEGLYHLWYNSYGGSRDPMSEKTGPRFECYAFSKDGVHWEKPNVGLIPPEGVTPLPAGGNYTIEPRVRGDKTNNIVRGFNSGQTFVDPFDIPSRRFKTIMGLSPTKAVGWDGWAAMKKVKGHSLYLAYSPDGIHWDLEAEPVLPFATGITSTVWDDSLQKWVVYVRVSIKGHKGDPWKSHIAYARVAVDKDKLAQPYPFTPDPNKKLNAYGSYGSMSYELPIVFEADERDPDHQVYTLPVVRYPEADLYLAFPCMWYPTVSDCDDAQFAFSRDGIKWQRPFRQPIIRLGMPGSGSEGYIDVTTGMIRRGNELWIYYTGLPERHLSPNVKWESIFARAIYRLDGFVSADAEFDGGELITRPLMFGGSNLELNLDTSAGGWAHVELQNESGQPIPGYTLKDAEKLNGNSVSMKANWGARLDLRELIGKPVRVRFVLRNCKFYAFQFV